MTTATKLQINWTNNGCDCGNCDFTVETVKGSDKQLFDGDKVVCNECGRIGEIEALGIDGCDVVWSDKYQPKATKCIAVKTPFGFIDLTFDGEEYIPSTDSRTQSTLKKCTYDVSFHPLNEQFVTTYDIYEGVYRGWLPIVAHHGDKFPDE